MGFEIRMFGKEILSVEKRSTLSSIKNPKEWLQATLGYDTSTGKTVNEDTSLTFSAIYGCLRILSFTFALQPFNVYKKEKNIRIVADDHPNNYLIHTKPNPLMTSFIWRQVMMTHAGLYGNAYSRIIRDANARPVEFRLISKPKDVDPFLYDDRLWYKVHGINEPVPADDMIHFKWLGTDGIKGKNPITLARENIGMALTMQQYGGEVFKKGGSKRLAFKSTSKIDPDREESMRKAFLNKYAGVNNMMDPFFLSATEDVKEIGIDPEDAQFIQSFKFSIEEIARFYGVQLHLLQSLDKATNNNIEHQSMEFVNYTMLPHNVNFEQELNSKIFRQDETKNHYTKLNIQGLLRGDMKTRAEWYGKMADLGVYSIDEMRMLEDQNPITGGDKHYIQVNREDINNPRSEKEKREVVLYLAEKEAGKPGNGKEVKATT